MPGLPALEPDETDAWILAGLRSLCEALVPIFEQVDACEAGAAIGQVLEIGCQQSLHSGRLVEMFPEWSDERLPLYAIARHG